LSDLKYLSAVQRPFDKNSCSLKENKSPEEFSVAFGKFEFKKEEIVNRQQLCIKLSPLP
jgi:hypothetical protein